MTLPVPNVSIHPFKSWQRPWIGPSFEIHCDCSMLTSGSITQNAFSNCNLVLYICMKTIMRLERRLTYDWDDETLSNPSLFLHTVVFPYNPLWPISIKEKFTISRNCVSRMARWWWSTKERSIKSLGEMWRGLIRETSFHSLNIKLETATSLKQW
jgi:hypothetical protein